MKMGNLEEAKELFKNDIYATEQRYWRWRRDTQNAP